MCKCTYVCVLYIYIFYLLKFLGLHGIVDIPENRHDLGKVTLVGCPVHHLWLCHCVCVNVCACVCVETGNTVVYLLKMKKTTDFFSVIKWWFPLSLFFFSIFLIFY